MTENDPLYQAILGCLYGQAIGDAMGMPSELWPQQQVRHYFGWIDQFLAGPPENLAACEFAAGQFTDDTQQAIALMDALLACQGQVDGQVIGEHLLAWAERIHAFDKNILGPSSKAALSAIRAGALVGQLKLNGVTNGAAMRIAPIGCLLPTHDKTAFIVAVREACRPTHQADIAVAGAFAIAWAISRAIEGASWQTIVYEVVKLTDEVQQQQPTTFSPALGRRIQWAWQLTLQVADLAPADALYELYQTIGAGMDMIESIPMAIAMVQLAKTDGQQVALLCANLGGDSDTIGAMATAICGALNGSQTFPLAWQTTISQANAINLADYAEQLLLLRMKKVNQA